MPSRSPPPRRRDRAALGHLAFHVRAQTAVLATASAVQPHHNAQTRHQHRVRPADRCLRTDRAAKNRWNRFQLHPRHSRLARGELQPTAAAQAPRPHRPSADSPGQRSSSVHPFVWVRLPFPGRSRLTPSDQSLHADAADARWGTHNTQTRPGRHEAQPTDNPHPGKVHRNVGQRKISARKSLLGKPFGANDNHSRVHPHGFVAGASCRHDM